ncbi:MAG: hypothetical protein HY683_04420 [Chloroflexi bacterium]|nr:hypothetical protein [Chloroflexota bacterium]
MPSLTRKDRELVGAAEAAVRRHYWPGRTRLASALRTRSGKTYIGLAIHTSVDRCSLCAEAAAVACAMAAGERELESIATVKYFPQQDAVLVVPPCGICRELLNDFGRVWVIYRANGQLKKDLCARLLPTPYASGKELDTPDPPQQPNATDGRGGLATSITRP